MKNDKRIRIRLEPEIVKNAREFAQTNRRSVSAEVNFALRLYYEHQYSQLEEGGHRASNYPHLRYP